MAGLNRVGSRPMDFNRATLVLLRRTRQPWTSLASTHPRVHMGPTSRSLTILSPPRPCEPPIFPFLPQIAASLSFRLSLVLKPIRHEMLYCIAQIAAPINGCQCQMLQIDVAATAVCCIRRRCKGRLLQWVVLVGNACWKHLVLRCGAALW